MREGEEGMKGAKGGREGRRERSNTCSNRPINTITLGEMCSLSLWFHAAWNSSSFLME